MRKVILIVGLLVSSVAFAQPIPGDDDSEDYTHLDTAKGVPYMTLPEQTVVFLLNQVRTSPKKFADTYFKDEPDTKSQECYDALTASHPMVLLEPSRALSLSSQDHASDMGNAGKEGHKGYDGSTIGERISRYGRPEGMFAENCSYGSSKPIGIVKQLLKSPGHRANIMNKSAGFVGVGIKPHRRYGYNAVMNFASDVEDVIPSLGKGFIVEDRPYWSMSAGYLNLPLPKDNAHMGKISMSYLHVDESLLQAFQLELGLHAKHQVVSFNYGFGVGPRAGYFHIGLLVGLGYAHLYEDEHIHGLYYRVSPMVDFMLPWWLSSSWRFFFSAGWTGVAVSNGDYDKVRNLGGASVELGVAFSWD